MDSVEKVFQTIYKFEKTIFNTIISIISHFFIGLFTTITIFPKYFILGIVYIFSKNKRNEINKTKSILPFIMMGLALIVYLICVFLFSRWSVQQLKLKYLAQDIISSTAIIEKEQENDVNPNNPTVQNPDNNQTEQPPTNNQTTQQTTPYYPNDYWDYPNVSLIDVNFDELLKKNSDTVGWIQVVGTKVNYPIVQSDDNEYYLYHSFNKSNNAGGWIFADYRVDFKNFKRNTIVYGHNLNNKTMFGSLPNTLQSSWFNNKDNHYVKISTPSSNSVWKVFSVYTVAPEVYYLKTAFTDDTYKEFITTIKNRSLYDFNTDVSIDDKIITLSTCDNTGTKRMVLHAKMINIEYK